MNFKAWLYSEVELGSDGMRDNQPTQTNQATNQSANLLQQSPKFVDRKANWMGMAGNSSALNKTYIKDVTWGMDNVVPKHVGGNTNVGNVAFKMSQSVPIKGLNIPKPKLFGMRKNMEKK